MARIKLYLPSTEHFSTTIPVRITDINYGGHLGNDSLLSLIHEARVCFLDHYGYSEHNIEGNAIIMNDVAIVYKSEAFHGDILRFRVSVVDFHRFGCDLFYRITKEDSVDDSPTAGSRSVVNREVVTSTARQEKEIARAKTGIVFYDYAQKKLVEVPEKFRKLFSPSSGMA